MPGPHDPGVPGFRDFTNHIRVSGIPADRKDFRLLLLYWVECMGGRSANETAAMDTSHVITWGAGPLTPEQLDLQQRYPHVRHVHYTWLMHCRNTWELVDDAPFRLVGPDGLPDDGEPGDQAHPYPHDDDADTPPQHQLQQHHQEQQEKQQQELQLHDSPRQHTWDHPPPVSPSGPQRLYGQPQESAPHDCEPPLPGCAHPGHSQPVYIKQEPRAQAPRGALGCGAGPSPQPRLPAVKREPGWGGEATGPRPCSADTMSPSRQQPVSTQDEGVDRGRRHAHARQDAPVDGAAEHAHSSAAEATEAVSDQPSDGGRDDPGSSPQAAWMGHVQDRQQGEQEEQQQQAQLQHWPLAGTDRGASPSGSPPLCRGAPGDEEGRRPPLEPIDPMQQQQRQRRQQVPRPSASPFELQDCAEAPGPATNCPGGPRDDGPVLADKTLAVSAAAAAVAVETHAGGNNPGSHTDPSHVPGHTPQPGAGAFGRRSTPGATPSGSRSGGSSARGGATGGRLRSRGSTRDVAAADASPAGEGAMPWPSARRQRVQETDEAADADGAEPVLSSERLTGSETCRLGRSLQPPQPDVSAAGDAGEGPATFVDSGENVEDGEGGGRGGSEPGLGRGVDGSRRGVDGSSPQGNADVVDEICAKRGRPARRRQPELPPEAVAPRRGRFKVAPPNGPAPLKAQPDAAKAAAALAAAAAASTQMDIDGGAANEPQAQPLQLDVDQEDEPPERRRRRRRLQCAEPPPPAAMASTGEPLGGGDDSKRLAPTSTGQPSASLPRETHDQISEVAIGELGAGETRLGVAVPGVGGDDSGLGAEEAGGCGEAWAGGEGDDGEGGGGDAMEVEAGPGYRHWTSVPDASPAEASRPCADDATAATATDATAGNDGGHGSSKDVGGCRPGPAPRRGRGRAVGGRGPAADSAEAATATGEGAGAVEPAARTAGPTAAARAPSRGRKRPAGSLPEDELLPLPAAEAPAACGAEPAAGGKAGKVKPSAGQRRRRGTAGADAASGDAPAEDVLEATVVAAAAAGGDGGCRPQAAKRLRRGQGDAAAGSMQEHGAGGATAAEGVPSADAAATEAEAAAGANMDAALIGDVKMADCRAGGGGDGGGGNAGASERPRAVSRHRVRKSPQAKGGDAGRSRKITTAPAAAPAVAAAAAASAALAGEATAAEHRSAQAAKGPGGSSRGGGRRRGSGGSTDGEGNGSRPEPLPPPEQQQQPAGKAKAKARKTGTAKKPVAALSPPPPPPTEEAGKETEGPHVEDAAAAAAPPCGPARKSRGRGSNGELNVAAAEEPGLLVAATQQPGGTQRPHGRGASGPKLVFALSGFNAEERARYGATLKALHLSYVPINNDWDPRINALLAPSLKRSDKTVCAMAAGAWLLRADYLAASQAQAQGQGGVSQREPAAGLSADVVDPEDFELHECEDGPSVISTGAPAHWRRRLAARGPAAGRAFSGLRVLVPPGLLPPLDSATLARMLTAGGGVAVVKAGPSAAKGCHVGVVPPGCKQEDKLVSSLRVAGAAVVAPAYVVDWVAHPGASLAQHYRHNTAPGEALAEMERERGLMSVSGEEE
ncbi:hypothetical protein PLESTF_001745400 [Pleodorina starrii]|nr:hypothetical protein PLESTF_001745400 [Pleodorina starrii]